MNIQFVIDTKKQNYYTFLFLSRRKINYQRELDFILLVKEQVEEKVEYFNNREDEFRSLNTDAKLSVINEMNKFRYIFDPEVEPKLELDVLFSIKTQQFFFLQLRTKLFLYL